MVDKLKGKWYSPGGSYTIMDTSGRKGTAMHPEDTLYISGGRNLKINQDGSIKLKEHTMGNKPVKDLLLEIIDDTHIKIDNRKVYEKKS